eukprot:scaffold6638_cov374-Prasinococcus_capsulatus_cf.AAC.7
MAVFAGPHALDDRAPGYSWQRHGGNCCHERGNEAAVRWETPEPPPPDWCAPSVVRDSRVRLGVRGKIRPSRTSLRQSGGRPEVGGRSVSPCCAATQPGPRPLLRGEPPAPLP